MAALKNDDHQLYITNINVKRVLMLKQLSWLRNTRNWCGVKDAENIYQNKFSRI